MNTCSTCKHWGGDSPTAQFRENANHPWKTCMRIDEYDEMRKPNEIAATFSREDGEFCTKATFGCVLHESKC